MVNYLYDMERAPKRARDFAKYGTVDVEREIKSLATMGEALLKDCVSV